MLAAPPGPGGHMLTETAFLLAQIPGQPATTELTAMAGKEPGEQQPSRTALGELCPGKCCSA